MVVFTIHKIITTIKWPVTFIEMICKINHGKLSMSVSLTITMKTEVQESCQSNSLHSSWHPFITSLQHNTTHISQQDLASRLKSSLSQLCLQSSNLLKKVTHKVLHHHRLKQWWKLALMTPKMLDIKLLVITCRSDQNINKEKQRTKEEQNQQNSAQTSHTPECIAYHFSKIVPWCWRDTHILTGIRLNLDRTLLYITK